MRIPVNPTADSEAKPTAVPLWCRPAFRRWRPRVMRSRG